MDINSKGILWVSKPLMVICFIFFEVYLNG